MKKKLHSYVAKLKNKKGMISIEYVMSFLTFIILISFVYDLAIIVTQRNRAVNVLQDIVRVVQVQSGVETSTPTYFPTVGNSYLRSDVFVSRAQSLFANLGIDPDTVVIEIVGTDLNGNPITREVTPNQSIQLKYKTPFTVRVSYNYSFSIWSNFAPGFNDCQQSITSTGLAEYKQNFDNWDGE